MYKININISRYQCTNCGNQVLPWHCTGHCFAKNVFSDNWIENHLSFLRQQIKSDTQKYYTVEFPFMPSRVTMLIYICSWHAWHPCPSSLFAEHLPCTHARRARDPCIKWGFWLVVHNLDCVQGFWLVVQKLDLVQFVKCCESGQLIWTEVIDVI